MDENAKKYIILDFDGTLIDTERVMLECIKEYAEIKGVRHDDAFTLQFVGACPADIAGALVKEYGRDFDAFGFLKGAVDYFDNKLIDVLTPLRPGARELLDFLSANGWIIALATTTRWDIAYEELKAHNLVGYFKTIITGDMVERNKPSPEIYFKTCEALGVKPENCFAVEDSTVGIESAIKAGTKTLAIPDLHPVREDLKPLCTGVFNDCFEVIEYLRQ